MTLKITEKQSYVLIQIAAPNGSPASTDNPIIEEEWLADADFPEASGELAIISGMPMTAVTATAARYKNSFCAIAVANPRMGCAFVICVTSPKGGYRMGQKIPLQ